MNDNCIFYFIIFVSGKYDIGSVFERKPVRKTFQSLASHNNDLTSRFLTEHFHICRNAHQKFVVFADCPVFICCYDNIHFNVPFSR